MFKKVSCRITFKEFEIYERNFQVFIKACLDNTASSQRFVFTYNL